MKFYGTTSQWWHLLGSSSPINYSSFWSLPSSIFVFMFDFKINLKINLNFEIKLNPILNLIKSNFKFINKRF